MEHPKRVVAQVREAWPGVKVVIGADSGSCREAIMARWEADGVGYVLGPAQDTRLRGMIAAEQERARVGYGRTKGPTRVLTDLRYRALDSWSRGRRVVAQAEHLAEGANPRSVVTSPTAEGRAAKALYEEDYRGRGEMEGRIEGRRLHPLADRTGARTMRADQVRLSRSSIAPVRPEALRRLGLAGAALAEAPCRTIRLELLKVGAPVRVTVREVWARLSSGCPYTEVSHRVHAGLSRLRPLIPRC